MNTILLQKILDILKEGLAHVGDFFKDLFVSDPQDGQVIGYDAEEGKWKNVDFAELSLELTHTAGPADSITITDAAADMPVKSIIVDMTPQQASGTPTPSDPLPISGTSTIVITHTYGEDTTETITVNLGSTVYYGKVDVVSGKLRLTHIMLSPQPWTKSVSNYATFYCVPSEVPKFISNSQFEYKCSHYMPVSVNNATAGGDNYIYVNSLKRVAVKDTSLSNLTSEEFTQYMEDVQFVYLLETPIVINLTPTIINTQGGSETFAVDANEMELEYYTATAGTIKDLVSITDDITSEVTKNTTDFSDILLKVSQNNKVVSVEIYSATTAAAVNDTFLSNLPKPAMNSKVLLANTTLGEDGTILGTLKTSGELEIATSGAKSFSGLITYVAK